MGRFTAYDQNGRMVADFDKSEYDLMHGWVGTEMERLRIENGKLRELIKEMHVCLEDECKRCHEWGDACELEQCMRELRVKVDA